MYYLDTNTCIYFLNGKYPAVREHLLSIDPAEICIPAIVKSELLTGAYKSNQKSRVLAKLDVFLRQFECESFTGDMAYSYADIRSELEQKGKTIGPNDLMIAATVVSRDGILVTHNLGEFKRVPGLKLEDWTR
ncbi:MAG: type II toxin-antitoxin system VapC family toxin [Eubacteriales bacterium]|nr:type II toxin-antitoxin system VapC family toxin [Eubacteriales bacterium]